MFIFSLVEVVPMKKSEMLNHNPEASGAYVHCIVNEKKLEDATNRLRETMLDDGYNVVNFGEAMLWQDYQTNGKVSKEMIQTAKELECNDVWCSPFYCFEGKEDD